MRTSFRIIVAGLISVLALGVSGSANAETHGPPPVVHCCAK